MEMLMTTTAKWGRRLGFDDFKIATAQSLAWYHRSQYQGPPLPDSHWARLAIRHVRNGRDLPGCATGPSDVLNQPFWQGAGMKDVKDSSPGPVKMASDREEWEMVMAGLDDDRLKIVELRTKGIENREVAKQLGRSPSRTSQMSRDIAERFGK